MKRTYDDKLMVTSKQMRAFQRELKTTVLECASYQTILSKPKKAAADSFRVSHSANVVDAVDAVLGSQDDPDDIDSLRKASVMARVLAAQLQEERQQNLLKVKELSSELLSCQAEATAHSKLVREVRRHFNWRYLWL